MKPSFGDDAITYANIINIIHKNIANFTEYCCIYIYLLYYIDPPNEPPPAVYPFSNVEAYAPPE